MKSTSKFFRCKSIFPTTAFKRNPFTTRVLKPPMNCHRICKSKERVSPMRISRTWIYLISFLIFTAGSLRARPRGSLGRLACSIAR